MKMKYLLASFIALLSLVLLTSMNLTQEAVTIVKEVQGKRLKFYAQNNTDETYELFFMIKSKGFRRSADRPMIKQIPAGRKVYLMNIIPLKGQDTSYTIIKNYEKSELRDLDFRKTDTIVTELRRVKGDTLG